MAKIKFKPEEFKVKEILKENFKSQGKYKVCSVWKKGLETEEALRFLAKKSKIPVNAINYAGLKDKNALTVQHISISSKYKIQPLENKNLKIQFIGFIDKPLHSKSILENRFEIVIRENLSDRDRINTLIRIGIPNYYGEQRFISLRNGIPFIKYLAENRIEDAVKLLFTPVGWENSRSRKGKKAFLNGNFHEALKLLTGWRRELTLYLLKNKNSSLREIFPLIPEKEIQFQANVFQSLLFNIALAKTIEEKTSQLLQFKYRGGIMLFPIEKIEIEEFVSIFHPEIKNPLYEKILKEIQLDRKSFSKLSKYFHKFNRKTFITLKTIKVTEEKEKTIVKFSLPPGSYATNTIRFLFDSIKYRKLS